MPMQTVKLVYGGRDYDVLPHQVREVEDALLQAEAGHSLVVEIGSADEPVSLLFGPAIPVVIEHHRAALADDQLARRRSHLPDRD